MQNIKIPKIVKYLWKGFKVLCFIVGLATMVGAGVLVYILTDNVANCLSEGHGVWDDDRKECRQDCLTWRKDLGCVPITEENARKKEQGLL
jgi:hypothetical protein